jgi:hypothetical protein
MDLYVCDANWLKTDLVDSFDSLIWTDRYNAYGDVTLTLPDTPANRALITEGIFLHMPLSTTIMLVETISIKDSVITATGTDLVNFLRNRLFRLGWQGTTDVWQSIGIAAYSLINTIMSLLAQPGTYLTTGPILTSAQGTNEVIPHLTVSATAPGLPNPGINISIPYGNLYDAIKSVADADNLGFTMYPPSMTDGTGNITFKTYRGLDRTTSQSTNPQVIFDPALDTLTGTEELRDISGYKNVAWVWPNGITAQTQVGVAYAPGANLLSSWQRRTIMVEATDVNVPDYTTANLALVLTQRGKDALANNNYSRLLTGQIVPQNGYSYGTDYNLGDIVELRGPSATAQKARITEYIRSQDPTGENAYPTLSVVG